MARLRPFVRDFAANLLLQSGVTRPARSGARRLTIATFHRVLPEEELAGYPLPEIVVTPAELSWFVRYFKKHFECGTLADTSRKFATDSRREQPLLAITFDDGQLDNFRHAKPVLDHENVRATFFVVVEAVERNETLYHDRLGFAVQEVARRHPREARALASRVDVPPNLTEDHLPHDVVIRSKKLPPAEKVAYLREWENTIGGPVRPDWDGMMSWSDLRALRAEGYEIGSHSMSHSILPLCTDQELVREIVDSRASLEQQLGGGIESFCYPNGEHEARTTRVVSEAGYTRAVTTKWGLNDQSAAPFELRRCDMQGQHARSARGKLSDARLAFRMSGFHPGLG